MAGKRRKRFVAQWADKCSKCSRAIEKGDAIVYRRTPPFGATVCDGCADDDDYE